MVNPHPSIVLNPCAPFLPPPRRISSRLKLFQTCALLSAVGLIHFVICFNSIEIPPPFQLDPLPSPESEILDEGVIFFLEFSMNIGQ